MVPNKGSFPAWPEDAPGGVAINPSPAPEDVSEGTSFVKSVLPLEDGLGAHTGLAGDGLVTLGGVADLLGPGVKRS